MKYANREIIPLRQKDKLGDIKLTEAEVIDIQAWIQRIERALDDIKRVIEGRD